MENILKKTFQACRDFKEYINQFEESNERLRAIASLDLGEQSEAAKRCIIKRELRILMIESGMSRTEAFDFVLKIKHNALFKI